MNKVGKGFLGSLGFIFIISLFGTWFDLADNNPLFDILGPANLLFIGIYIYGVIIEEKLFTVGAYFLDIVLWLICLGVMNDFPYFIRKIPGEDVT